jgi:surfactin synthase thioesterase subunit
VVGEASVTYYINRLSSQVEGLLKTALYNMLAADDVMTNDYEQHYQNWYQLAARVELIKINSGGHLFIRDNAAETAGIILKIIKEAKHMDCP